jgi:hypothetical protein
MPPEEVASQNYQPFSGSSVRIAACFFDLKDNFWKGGIMYV